MTDLLFFVLLCHVLLNTTLLPPAGAGNISLQLFLSDPIFRIGPINTKAWLHSRILTKALVFQVTCKAPEVSGQYCPE